MRPHLLALATVVAWSVCLPNAAKAQEAGTQLGLKGVVGLATIAGDDASGAESRLSLGGGGFLRFSPGAEWSIQTEALFMLKGAGDKDGGGTADLSYIEVPALLVYRPSAGGNVRPAFYAGPAVAFLVSATDVHGDDIKDVLETVDYSAAFGAGLEFPLDGGSSLFFDARYTAGLASIDRDGEFDEKNRVFSLGLSYLWPR
jgi:hypothetical protein